MTGGGLKDKLNPFASKKSEIRTSLNDRFGGGIRNFIEVYQKSRNHEASEKKCQQNCCNKKKMSTFA